jgi:sensor domain CHASE-containing protein
LFPVNVLFTKAKLEGWALVAEIGGAVAVIVSVIYLGRQINDNTKLLRSQAHYNALSLAQKPLEMMVENESLAGAVTECDANPNGVPATTWARCANYYFMQFNSWEYTVLPESRRFNPATALGRSGRLLQDARASEARLRALLE